MYEWRKLNIGDIEWIYNSFMKKDFPKNELKPLSMIKKAISKNEYECYGVYSDNSICSYSFFATLKAENKSFYLLDYFATVSGLRGQGIGSESVRLMKKNIKGADIIICEAENPDYSKGNERITRERRVSFYLKNGFADTNVRASVFGVDFILLELNTNGIHSESEVETAYSNLYESFLPKLMFKKFFHISKSEDKK